MKNTVAATASKHILSKPADWWRGAVIYQIYPRSYHDSNNDGIGDLAGITQRLPYIASLGVDAIWISPFFPSPMKDFGYDVSDYCNVDPMFGSLQDFDELLATAHNKGLKVMIDLVMSHTSALHPWFQESRKTKDNDKADWYVWADPKTDGTPPNNWLSFFGGSAWQWDGRRMQYYFHNFLASQPDLNFHCEAVQDALLDVARFWLDRGVDGFRLDTINFYMHDKELRSNPPLSSEFRNASIAPAVNPYNYQEHKYDRNHPDNVRFLRKLRAVMDPYHAAAVGEVGDAQNGLKILGEYTAGDDLMHMCYAFELLSQDTIDACSIANVMNKVNEVAADGWPCWAYSNHDVVRHATRWNASDQVLRCMTALIMCLRGSACIYQGEELGLREAIVGFDDIRDPYGIEFWPEFKGRDGCRTPMVWQAQAINAGFGGGAKPWLPICVDQTAKAVDAQEEDIYSLLSSYKNILQLRRKHRILAVGAMTNVVGNGSILSFDREWEGRIVHLAFNLSDSPAVHKPSAPCKEEIDVGIKGLVQGTMTSNNEAVDMPAWGIWMAEG